MEAILGVAELKWLVAMRNVFVHKGGRADEEFRKLVSDHQVLKTIEYGKPVIATGKIIEQLVRGMIAKGTELLTFVNDWMKSNPR